MFYSKKPLILLLFSIILINCLFGTGSLHIRERWSSDPYHKMSIETLNVSTKIQDQVAETHVEQVFKNKMNESGEAMYIFPLPENAMVTSMAYWVNGERYEAEIREREEAKEDYQEHKEEWLDPALMEKLSDNLYRLKIVPVAANSEVKTEITYIEMCPYEFGKTSYEYQLNTTGFSPDPLETVHLQIDAKSQNPYKYFKSPTHNNSTATQIQKKSESHYTLEYGDENFTPEKNLSVEWETQRDKVQYSLLTYSPTAKDSMGNKSFYAVWVTPPDNVGDKEIIPKDIVFAADVSSSMEGERISALKESLQYFLDNLNDIDRFNIVTFGTKTVSFRDSLVKATSQNIDSAQNFVSQIYASGLTDISAALDRSLSYSFGDSTSNNLVFLTDGKPTWGTTGKDSIISKVNQNNQDSVRIFSFGIGNKSCKGLLNRLSLANNGYAQTINSNDSIEIVINNHFKRISKPVMTDLKFDFNGVDPYDKYPKNISDLFWGSQTMEMGRYSNSGEFNVELSGRMRDDSVNYSKTMYFPDTTGGFRFVPRLWAREKIDHLLDLIAIYGEKDELVNQIINLSLTYGILTEYTALYAEPDDDESAIENDKKVVPKDFKLHNNYPNPFNPTTNITYDLPPGNGQYKVIIKVYDIQGRLVKVLKSAQQSPGRYTVQWNGTDKSGQRVANGVYIYSIQAGKYKSSGKMLFLK